MTKTVNIFNILADEPTIILSWSFEQPQEIENGLRFKVSGFRFQGDCEVVYDEGTDTFTFQTLDPDGQTMQETTGLYLDNLVDCIDRIVEIGDDIDEYKKTIDEWLKKH